MKFVFALVLLVAVANARPSDLESELRKRGFFDDLKGTFSQLGHVFTDTFSALGHVAAQQGADLLNQALQQGSTLLSNATATLAHNLANPQPQKRNFFDDLKGTFGQLGHVFTDTFSALGQVAAQQGAALLNQALQQGSTLLSNATATLAQNLANPQPQKRNFFDDLKGTFGQLGHVFTDTFSALGQVAAQQGAALLNQALQQGSTLLSNATATLAQNLANPQPQKRNFFDDLKGTFGQLGHVFTDTFSALGQVAAQQGAALLNQALQQGSTLLSNATASALYAEVAYNASLTVNRLHTLMYLSNVEKGASLLNQALQQGSTLIYYVTATLANNLANPQPQKRNFFDDLKGTFSQLGSVFTDTFSALGQVAAQQGAALLNQALQQGSTLLSNATATLAHNLATPQ